jgi:hypothetical protein
MHQDFLILKKYVDPVPDPTLGPESGSEPGSEFPNRPDPDRQTW